jgi:uncharacterized protein (UPF0333 family)
MEKPLVRFLREERAQGSLEYIILMGGIVILAVFISNSYFKIAKSQVAYINESTTSTFGAIRNTVYKYISG